VGLGFTRTTHGFRNEPYATNQKFSALYSFNKAGRFNYFGEFNHITRNADIVLIGEWRTPALSNFFGLGNTAIKESGKSYNFYRSRFNTIEIQPLIRHRYFENLHVLFGPYYYHYSAKYSDNAKHSIGQFNQYNLDSADIFSSKNYLGGKLWIKVDNRNDAVFPTRGVLWNTEVLSTLGIGHGSNNYSRVTSDMTVYASLSDPARVVAVVGIGGGRILTKNYEYFQAMSLGAGNNNLHGFRKNRYLGQSSLYGSFELRVKVWDVNSYTLRGPFGLTGFYDIGRVRVKGDGSRKWHGAYGGGFYFIPYGLFFISATVGFSANEKLMNFTLGSKINLTF
jgi:outer membrane protein assembly factor BamA